MWFIQLKIKKSTLWSEFDQCLKPYIEFNTQKGIKAEKMVTKTEKHSTD